MIDSKPLNEKESAGIDIEDMMSREAMRLGNEREGNTPPSKDPMNPPTGGGVQLASAFGKFIDGVKGAASWVDRGVGRATGGFTDPRTQDAIGRLRERQDLEADENLLDEESAGAVFETLDTSAVESPPAVVGEGGSETLLGDMGATEATQNIDAAAVQKRFEEDGAPEDKRTDTRNLNTERHMPGAAADVSASIEEAKTADDVAAIFDAVALEIGDNHVVRSNKTLEEMSLDDVKAEMKGYLAKGSKQLATDRQLYAARTVLSTMGTEVAEIANKIGEGNATRETLLTYQKKIRALAAVQNHLRGNVREVARALQQQSVIAQTLKRGSLGDLDELMNVANMTPEQIQRHAQVVAKRIKEDGPVAGTNPKFIERMQNGIALAAEYWKANLLSGVETHLVNMEGNGLYNIYENMVVRPVAAGVGKALQKTKWGSDTDRVHIGETMGALVSSYAGLRDGMAVMANTLAKDESLFMTGGKGEAQGLMSQAANQVQGETSGKFARGAAKTLSMPFRFLQAEDDLFKTLAYRQEITSLALRDAYGKGLTGKAAYKEAMTLIKDPSDDIHNAAIDYAKNLTYTNTDQKGVLGFAGDLMKKLTARYPIFSFVTPFINTPVNLMQRATDMSVLSVVNTRLHADIKKGGAARDTALAKMAIGTSITASVYMMYEGGLITGNGPKDHAQRQVLEKTGWKPNSIRDPKTGTYHPYKRLEPFAGAIGGLVNDLEAAKYANNKEDASVYAIAAVFGIAKHAMNGTFMKGVNDLFALGERKSPSNYLAGIGAGFVPAYSMSRTITKVVDPQRRRTSDDKEFQTGFTTQLQQRVKQSIPGMSFSLRPARYWDGSVATPDQGRMAYAMAPVKSSKDKGATPVDAELIKNGVPIKEPNPMVTIGKGPQSIHFSLIDMDNGDGLVYDEYYKAIGDRRKEFLQALISQDSYKELTPGPGGERHLEMRRAVHQAKVQGTEDFFKHILLPMYHENPENFNEIALQVGLDREDFYYRINESLSIKEHGGVLPEDLEAQTEHVRRGTGRRDEALPMPTDKVREDKPFEVRF